MEEIKPLKGDLTEAIKQIIKLQGEALDKLKSGIVTGIPKKYFGEKQ